MFTVYIIYSEKLKRYYTGFTSNIELRMSFHKARKVGKFTSKADDWEIYLEINCVSKEQGLSIERHIKKMKSSVYIENLKKYPEIIDRLRERYP